MSQPRCATFMNISKLSNHGLSPSMQQKRRYLFDDDYREKCKDRSREWHQNNKNKRRLPDSVGELLVWREFYTVIKALCEVIRIGPRVDLSPVASYELNRVSGIIRKITMKLARLEKKGKA